MQVTTAPTRVLPSSVPFDCGSLRSPKFGPRAHDDGLCNIMSFHVIACHPPRRSWGTVRVTTTPT